jgi:hypothetical protein
VVGAFEEVDDLDVLSGVGPFAAGLYEAHERFGPAVLACPPFQTGSGVDESQVTHATRRYDDVRRVTVMSLAIIGLLATGCEEPNTTDYDPVGAAAAEAGVSLSSVPPEQITSCVESTKYDAFFGQAAALARWNAVGQSEDALSDLCRLIGRDDPATLATMHSDWTAAQSSRGVDPEAPD